MPSADPRTSPSLVRPPGYQAIKAGGADETGMNDKQLPAVHGGRSHPARQRSSHTATSAAPNADHPGWPARRHGRHCSGSRARVLSHSLGHAARSAALSALLISVVASFVASNGVLPWDSMSTVCFLTCTDGPGAHGVVGVRRTRNT